MKLKLFVLGKLIKEMSVFTTGYKQRLEVDYLTCYLKKRFRDILKPGVDWEIILTAKSGMNEHKKNQ